MLKRTIVVAAVLLAAASAEAQYGGPHQIQPTESAVWGELAFFTGESELEVGGIVPADLQQTIVSMLFEGYVGIDPIELAFAWGFAHGSFSVDTAAGEESESAFAPGNPFVGVRFVHAGDAFVLRLGGGLALPVAQLDEDDGAEAAAEALALIGSTAIRGLWDTWLWWPDRMTVVVPSFRIDSTRSDLVWAAEAALGMMIHTGDDDGDDVETEVPFQVAGELGGRLSRSVVLGGRLQLWWLTTGEDDEDNAQLSMMPFVRFEGENAFGYAGLTMNLDDPLGFAFDDDGYWGLRFGGGARF